MATYKEKQIAVRIPPGDKWKIEVIEGTKVSEHKEVYSSLTDVLEAFYKIYKYKGDFKVSPSKGKIFVMVEDIDMEGYTSKLESEIIEMKIPKKYSIYGDIGEK